MDTGPQVAFAALIVAVLIVALGVALAAPVLTGLGAGLAGAATTWLVTRSAIVSALRKVRDEG